MKTQIVLPLLAAFLALAPSASSAQSNSQTNAISGAGDGLYFMYYDSSQSKSTIVEFDDFVVLIEVPVKDQGGSATVLEEHADGGEKVLRTLKEHFPTKPLRYVIHSHWHPHSISSVLPFITNGVTLVSTRKNFERLKEFVSPDDVARYGQYIAFVDGDSLVIGDPGNRIVVHRFTQEEYPNTPSADYLYCYLPKYNYLHCACMYNKWTGEPVDGKELLTGREEDLNRFLAVRNIRPEYLIRLNKEKTETNDMQPYDGLRDVMENGISATALSDGYLALDESTLRVSRDSLVRTVVRDHIPVSVINRAVYSAIGRNAYSKAAQLAHLQAAANPSDPNVWDTLGEVHYFIGDTLMARSFGKQAKLISPSFEGGGENTWRKNLAEHQKKTGAGK